MIHNRYGFNFSNVDKFMTNSRHMSACPRAIQVYFTPLGLSRASKFVSTECGGIGTIVRVQISDGTQRVYSDFVGINGKFLKFI